VIAVPKGSHLDKPSECIVFGRSCAQAASPRLRWKKQMYLDSQFHEAEGDEEVSYARSHSTLNRLNETNRCAYRVVVVSQLDSFFSENGEAEVKVAEGLASENRAKINLQRVRKVIFTVYETDMWRKTHLAPVGLKTCNVSRPFVEHDGFG
jgi:hypothetical protein